jgi:hypothetical protein
LSQLLVTGAAILAASALTACGGDNGGPPPLSITASSPPAGTTGAAYAGYTFTASGGTPPLSWTKSGSLPLGLTLSAAGRVSGMPATAGTYPITITVADSSMPPLTASAPVSLRVNDSPIVIASTSPPAGIVSRAYPGFSFSASGGSPPYNWKASGTLPPGLTFGSGGTVSGTPTQVGTYVFSVIATDSALQPMTSPPLATQIVIGNPGPGALTLNHTPIPPAGIVGTPYGPFRFSATGGYLPLTWSITAGNLPPGLTLGTDSSLSGTPTSAGDSMFTVTVTDSAPTPASNSLPFTINVFLPPPPTINYVEPPTGTVESAYTPFQFTANGGLPPLSWSEKGALPTGLSLSNAGVLSGTPTMPGHFPIQLNLSDFMSRAASPVGTTVRVSLARPPAGFTPTGSMGIPRSGHAATLLISGKVLVTGGGHGLPDATAELYDPVTATFSPTAGNMNEARSGHTATLLKLSSSSLQNYGKVLIVGPTDLSAELYDPTTSTFAATGSMHHARTLPTATLLKTNKVLIVGGNYDDLTAELYDPGTGSFSDTGSTTVVRSGHTATLLIDGRVLIAGGGDYSNTAELYDPSSGTFTAIAADMSGSRSGHTATLLGAADKPDDGAVLVIGTDGTADLYHPDTQTFEQVGSLPSRQGHFDYSGHTASLRNDGTVLATGGYAFRVNVFICVQYSSYGGADLFAPESEGFTATGSLNTPRENQTATVLQDGTILVAGGVHRAYNGRPSGYRPKCTLTTVLSSAELFK